MSTKIYSIKNLDCANCAAKIERKASAIEGIEELVITYSTMKMKVTANDPDSLLPEIIKEARKIEPDIEFSEISKRERSSRSEEAHEHHHEACGCSEHHHHDDDDDDNDCGCGEHHHHDDDDDHDDCGCGKHHHDDDDCGCGKHHHHDDDDCGCGEHHHHDDNDDHDDCGCGCGGHHHHDDDDDCDCGCGEHHHHDEKESKAQHNEHEHEHSHEHGDSESNTREFVEIIAGVVVFIAAVILNDKIPAAAIALFVAAYLILGYNVLLKAFKNITRGQIFDENFLMSIATLGAFAIKSYPEAVGVMLFYRVGELFEDIAVARSRSQIIEAIDMRPETVNLVTDDSNETKVIPAEDAYVGDILLVRAGDRIPLDGVIVEGETRIDTSPVTGEPVPVKAVVGSSVTSGCINTSGVIKMRVEKELDESMVTKILNSVENAAASKPKIDRFITKFARIYTPVVVAIAILTAIIPSLITGDWHHWVYTALSFLVISCPCALVLSVPLAFFSGIGAGSKKGILFKGGLSLEALANVKAVVMDKTGTITKGDFSVQNIVTASSLSSDKVLAYAAACEMTSTHPIGCSIVEAVKARNIEIPNASDIEEISGHGIKAIVEGHTVLCGNLKLMNKFEINAGDYKNNNAGSEVLLAVDGKYVGYIVISDTIKPEATSAIERIRKFGIKTAMLTGDSKESAENIARLTGINEVHAKLLPEDKLTKLNDIRETHGAVMFVGDGINDAPVLAGANVGAAMGSGADAAIEAADVVIMKSDVSAIPSAISIAKTSTLISRENVIFALAVKAIFMILGLCGFSSMWMAVFADTGVAMICIINSIRALYKKY